MDLKRFKDFKEEKLKSKQKLEKISKRFVVGKRYVKSVLEQQKLYLSEKNETCIGLLDQDMEDYGIGLIIQEKGIRKKLIPVYLRKDHSKADYTYLDYSFSSKEVSNGLKDIFKKMPYFLIFDIEWIVMVRFETKKEAVEFLENNQDYSKIIEQKLQEFEIRDLLKSGKTDELKKKMIIQISE